MKKRTAILLMAVGIGTLAYNRNTEIGQYTPEKVFRRLYRPVSVEEIMGASKTASRPPVERLPTRSKKRTNGQGQERTMGGQPPKEGKYTPMEANAEMRVQVLAAKTPEELCRIESWISTKWSTNGDEKLAQQIINDQSLTPYEHCKNIGGVRGMAEYWWNWLAAGVALLGFAGLAFSIRDSIKQRMHERQMEQTAIKTTQRNEPEIRQPLDRVEPSEEQPGQGYRDSNTSPYPGDYAHFSITDIIRHMKFYNDLQLKACKWKGGVRVNLRDGSDYYLDKDKRVFKLEKGRIFTKRLPIENTYDIPTAILPYVDVTIY